jgi:site-specific recombinase XerD
MPNVNFYLKAADGSGNSLIILQMKYRGQRLVYSTGETVDASNWNEKKQKLRSNSQTTKDGEHSINDLLVSLESVLTKAYNNEIKSGIPSPDTLKKYLKDFMNKNIGKIENRTTLLSFIEDYMKESKGEKAENTIKKYGTLLTHLKEYYKKKQKIDFDSINLDFFRSYVTFLKAKGLAKNTIAKDIAVLKGMMSEAIDRNHTTNINFKHKKFSYSYEDVDSVYLNEAEIEKLYKHDFLGKKKLEQIRDLFVFGCNVGLRYSDYSSVKQENIITIDGNKYIKINTQKTDETVIIPCNETVLKIFDKYSGNANSLPRTISAQKFNEYLKDVCKEAGFTKKGRLITQPDVPLYDCITSHTARRSFCTNLYLSGFPSIEIMKISGHRTEKAFLKYIKVGKQEAAERLYKHMETRTNKLQAV